MLMRYIASIAVQSFDLRRLCSFRHTQFEAIRCRMHPHPTDVLSANIALLMPVSKWRPASLVPLNLCSCAPVTNVSQLQR